ncbi:MAG: CoA pyrophosphatase [Gemmatimonadetes bacterium]|nr:CoA pyrophosphatase [Gemmatimonadota bacterium]MYB97425.1 CoA pyrophosphatase [Gemmatimonadota bacterium]MYH53363.1 CoA pyrophosphatase [Gemmatimonadota bacterium]MYK66968.1 CoA pyrophosphatase [Gemmatimonadota bacterium]
MPLRLSGLARALGDRFGPVESAVPDRNRRNAAVALVLRGAAGVPDPPVRDCEVLVIRRSDSPRDPWSGQMALPGGSMDEADDGLLATAVRETREETGLGLDRGRGVIGRLETARPMGVRLPVITIWPFVFRAVPDAVARVGSPEVASVHWFRVKDLADRGNRGSYQWREGGLVRAFPCIELEGRVIWGLTYRIVTGFLGMPM